MPNEMTAAEAAEMCDSIADGYEFDQQEESDYHDEWISKLRYAASLCRKIASGEYAPVVHAHIFGRGYDLHCSNCGVSADIGKNYCHFCGAIFDGKDDAE